MIPDPGVEFLLRRTEVALIVSIRPDPRLQAGLVIRDRNAVVIVSGPSAFPVVWCVSPDGTGPAAAGTVVCG